MLSDSFPRLFCALLSAVMVLVLPKTSSMGQDNTAIDYDASDRLTFYLGKHGARKMILGVDGQSAVQIDVSQTGAHPWSVVHHSPVSSHPIRKGDLVTFEIRLRVTGRHTHQGKVGVYLESAVDTKTGAVGQTVYPDKRLQTFRGDLICPGDFAASELRLAVHLAGVKQVVEFYGARVWVSSAAERRRTKQVSWEGREPDAAWRREADQRIDQFRKQNVLVRVMNAQGDPVPGAAVSIKQQKHAWRFGTFLSEKMLGDSQDATRYRREILRRYNFVTLPAYNAPWGWRDDRARKQYFGMADWADQNGLPARGHVLVYPGTVTSPEEWIELPPGKLRKKLASHIPDAVKAFRQRGVQEWDVTNELRQHAGFMERLGGLDVAADWFKDARAMLPKGDLYLNEYSILSEGGHTGAEQTILERQFRRLNQSGAEIDGIGLQGHFDAEVTAPQRIFEILERMSKLTGKVMVTEFDIDHTDRSAQADYLRDFYTVCFSHPAVQGVVAWGFWEGDMWKPNGHLLDRNWKENPAGKAYRDLVLNRWWTSFKHTTNVNGQTRTRAFKGTHELTVTHGDYQWSKEILVGEAPLMIECVVP